MAHGVDAAQAALGRGDVDAAASLLRQTIANGSDPTARHMLGGLLFFDDDFAGARGEWEAAFREWTDAGEIRLAALVTADLADLFASAFGNRVAGEAWQRRGRRLLDPVGRCVERGYVDLAFIACEVDVSYLETAAREAAALADEFGDAELAVLAAADAGYARVVQGDVDGGFALLDDAMTSLAAGAVRNPAVVGKSYCALMSACDRSGDVRRGVAWIDTVKQTLIAPLGGRPRASRSHCDLAYGSLMCTAGEVDEGETSILRVLGREGSAYASHRTEAAARLASVRITQGRTEEAAELLRPIEDRVAACEPLARLHLLSGELDLAAAVARRGLEACGHDRLRAGALRGIAVEIALANDDHDAASAEADALAELAALSGRALRAEALLARGRVVFASGDVAASVSHFDGALAELPEDARPLLRATIELDLAQAMASAGDRGGALDRARVSLAALERLGALVQADRATALLRSMGARVRHAARRTAGSMPSLTERERQVLELVRSGLTNAEIAARLYIAPKTAEHHVGRLLAKLGVRTRAEAAAVAAAAAAGGAGTK